MRRILAFRVVALLFAASTTATLLRAHTVWELWLSMPDTIEGLIDADYRGYIALVDSVPNCFEGSSHLDTLAADEMRVTLTSRTSLHLRLLPAAVSGDSVLCVIHTYRLVAPESSVRVYDTGWRLLADVTFPLDDLVERPDTMSAERYAELLRLFDPYLVSATFDEAERGAIVVTAAAALVSDDERKALEAITLRRRYVWDGSRFESP